jgi:hypothetical protein
MSEPKPTCLCGSEAVGIDWAGPVCFDCADDDMQALV